MLEGIVYPSTEIKMGEIFAPAYNSGEKIAIWKVYDEGIEIRIMIVNNRFEEVHTIIGTTLDANDKNRMAVNVNDGFRYMLPGGNVCRVSKYIERTVKGDKYEYYPTW